MAKESDLFDLYYEFQQKWPRERIEKMSLAEYTKLGGKDSFCYWMESKLDRMGSIWGGSSAKFGIYEHNVNPKPDTRMCIDDQYSWYNKYGQDRNLAFEKVRSMILDIIDAVQSDNLEAIDAIDLGEAYKWKIAFHYQKDIYNPNVISVYKHNGLQLLHNLKGKSMAECQRVIMSKKPSDMDIHTYSDKVWQDIQAIVKVEPHKQTDVKNKYTWMPFFEEMAKNLMSFDNPAGRKQLVNLAKPIFDAGLNSVTIDAEVKMLDPFSFIGIIRRLSDLKSDSNYWKEVKKELKISAPIPSDLDGCPSFRNDRYPLSYRLYDENIIESLWKLFKAANTDDGYQLKKQFDILDNAGIDVEYITRDLAWIKPEMFPYIDENFGEQLYNTCQLNSFSLSGSQYLALSKKINTYFEAKGTKQGLVELYMNNYEGLNEIILDDAYQNELELLRRKKNIILQGAPGTGKTYVIPELVVRLCNPTAAAIDNSRESIVEEYNRLKEEKRVFFTTFHQSMDYEDWIEGLRPDVDENKNLKYTVERGIFKALCEEAETPIVMDTDSQIAQDAVVWKVSLKGTGDNPIRKDCFKNNCIRIGYKEVPEQEDWDNYTGAGKSCLDAFINRMKIGDIVMTCYSNTTIDAIGVVTGDYEYHSTQKDFKRYRSVNWLVKDIRENIVDLNDGKLLTTGSVYRLNSITLEKVRILLDKHIVNNNFEENNRPYVMVIDEFNRGNVSKIFGELITLLETDKRKGEENEESVILPYSKSPFYVPSNVYIIATMNTADRSLGVLDYAIRRRFAFITTKPKVLQTDNFDEELFKQVSSLFISNYDEYVQSGCSPDFEVEPSECLSEEFKPEDVWLGHSYFIMSSSDDKKYRIKNEILPLLNDYVRDGVLKDSDEVRNAIADIRSLALE